LPPIEDIERPLAIAVLILIVLPFAIFGWAYRQDKILARNFQKVSVGATREDVVRLLGKPKYETPCGEFMGPQNPKHFEGCAKEYVYASPFANWLAPR
jgi:hypothetical protein